VKSKNLEQPVITGSLLRGYDDRAVALSCPRAWPTTPARRKCGKRPGAASDDIADLKIPGPGHRSRTFLTPVPTRDSARWIGPKVLTASRASAAHRCRPARPACHGGGHTFDAPDPTPSGRYSATCLQAARNRRKTLHRHPPLTIDSPMKPCTRPGRIVHSLAGRARSAHGCPCPSTTTRFATSELLFLIVGDEDRGHVDFGCPSASIAAIPCRTLASSARTAHPEQMRARSPAPRQRTALR